MHLLNQWWKPVSVHPRGIWGLTRKERIKDQKSPERNSRCFPSGKVLAPVQLWGWATESTYWKHRVHSKLHWIKVEDSSKFLPNSVYLLLAILGNRLPIGYYRVACMWKGNSMSVCTQRSRRKAKEVFIGTGRVWGTVLKDRSLAKHLKDHDLKHLQAPMDCFCQQARLLVKT